MRPKKVVLCVDSDGGGLAERRFLLRTRGYRAVGALGAEDAGEILAVAADRVDLVVMQVRHGERDAAGELCRATRAAGVPMLACGPDCERPSGAAAQCWLTEPAAAALIAEVKIAAAGRRGPKSRPLRGAEATA